MNVTPLRVEMVLMHDMITLALSYRILLHYVCCISMVGKPPAAYLPDGETRVQKT